MEVIYPCSVRKLSAISMTVFWWWNTISFDEIRDSLDKVGKPT